MQLPKKPHLRLSTVRAAADRWYARYIRLRDTQEQNGKRVGKCVTCGKFRNIWKLECGHYQSRRHDPTRWDALNSHTQDTACNKWRSGEQAIMALYINNKYGKGSAQKLILKSRDKRRFLKYEVKGIADYYKGKCEEILGEDNLTDKRWNEILNQWK